MILLRFLPLVVVVLVVGCEPEPSERRLQVTLGALGGPVAIDTVCEQSCAGNADLALRVDYTDDFYPPDEIIELLQYRIDYDLHGVKGEVPFFAGTTHIALVPGQSAELSLVAAGSAQRAFVLEPGRDATVAGIATLSLAGYDWNNEEVLIESTFEIEFLDVGANDAADAGAVEDAADAQ